MPYLQKFSEKSLRAPSSRNRTEEGVGLEKEDTPERRGFWDRVDLHLGVIEQTNARKRERERERERIRKVPTTVVYKNVKK